jgi:hypothetical protein
MFPNCEIRLDQYFDNSEFEPPQSPDPPVGIATSNPVWPALGDPLRKRGYRALILARSGGRPWRRAMWDRQLHRT